MPKHEYGREGAYLQNQVFWRVLLWTCLGIAFLLFISAVLSSVNSPLVCLGALFLLPPLLVAFTREFFSSAKRTVHPYTKGLSGEVAVAAALRGAIGDEGYLVHDLKIGDRGNIDHVAVMPGGIYSIETKAWEGAAFVRGSRLWVNRSEQEYVLRQAFAESRAVRDYLDRVSGCWKHDVLPVLVFTHARLNTPGMCRGVWVTDLPNLASALQYHTGVLDHMQRSRIAGALGKMTSVERTAK
jgi:hypothetical protein